MSVVPSDRNTDSSAIHDTKVKSWLVRSVQAPIRVGALMPDGHSPHSQIYIFGRHNIAANPSPEDHGYCCHLEARSMHVVCAQELFSMVFASVLHCAKEIGDTNNSATPIFSNITGIQNLFTQNGLASASDAMSCIPPPILLQERLPRAASRE
ncbi:hypothetical protein BJX70DRAFT_8087 [Aspergillus crustosus]